MEIKIRIRTPIGHAMSVEKKLRLFIIGSKKKLLETYVSPENDEFIWNIGGSVRDIISVQNNVNKFDMFVRKTLDSKIVKNTLRKKLSPKDEKYLVDMLNNHTKIEIIKSATAFELVEENLTWWGRIKKKFVRMN